MQICKSGDAKIYCHKLDMKSQAADFTLTVWSYFYETERKKGTGVDKYIQLKNRRVGDGQPCYIIAEMSANHGGEYNQALEIVHAAAESGADCIKLQTYTADTITMNSQKEYFKISNGLWKGETLYNLYLKAFTPWDWQPRIKEEAEKIGLDFLSTPFDPTAVEFLEQMGVEFYKISSFEIVDIPLLRLVASKGKPILLSTGMATEAEIGAAVNAIRAYGSEVLLMKCSSAYPADPTDMNLSTLQYLKETFNVPVGLSDHSMGCMSVCTAVALGAKAIEKHLCIGRDKKTPDSEFSMEPQEFLTMTKNIRIVEKSIGSVKFGPSADEAVSVLHRKSIFVTADIEAGDAFTGENIRVIRPSQGMNPMYYDDVLGKTSTSYIEAGTPLKREHITGFSTDGAAVATDGNAR